MTAAAAPISWDPVQIWLHRKESSHSRIAPGAANRCSAHLCGWRGREPRSFSAAVAKAGAGVALFSMGAACGDFDGNGWSDLYVTNLQGYEDGYNPLLLNQGDGTFVEASEAAGVDHWITSWGSIFAD